MKPRTRMIIGIVALYITANMGIFYKLELIRETIAMPIILLLIIIGAYFMGSAIKRCEDD